MGWITGADGAVIANPTTNYLYSNPPASVFLTRTDYYLDLDSGAVVNTFVLTYNIYGKLTTSGNANWPDWVSHRGSRTVLSDPYTFAQAVDYAVQLLSNVDLLRPDRVYSVHQGGYDMAVLPKRLTYPSEAAAYPYGQSVGNIYVHTTEDGAVYLSSQGYPGVSGPFANAALRGAMFGVDTDPRHLSGWAMAQKTAARTPTIFRSKIVFNFDQVYLEERGLASPVNLGPGEFLFYPTDVPDYGMVQWSTAPAPGLAAPP